MPWGAAAAVAAAGIGYAGSQSAAGKQEAGANKASRVQQAQWEQSQRNMSPYLRAGEGAQNALTGWLGVRPDGSVNPNAPGLKSFSMADFEQDPGYAWRMQQGEDALQNRRSAMGGQFSGATLRDLNDYAQGSASQEFGNAYNRFRANQSDIYGRLSGQAGQGASVASGVGGLGAQYASGIGQNIMGGANAAAAGIVGGANAINSGIGQGYNMWQQQQIQKQPPAQNPYASSYSPNSGGMSLNLIGDAANDPYADWYTPSYFGNK